MFIAFQVEEVRPTLNWDTHSQYSLPLTGPQGRNGTEGFQQHFSLVWRKPAPGPSEGANNLEALATPLAFPGYVLTCTFRQSSDAQQAMGMATNICIQLPYSSPGLELYCTITVLKAI